MRSNTKKDPLYNNPCLPFSFSYKLYNCIPCGFHTNNKKDFEKHSQTSKHSKRTEPLDIRPRLPRYECSNEPTNNNDDVDDEE